MTLPRCIALIGFGEVGQTLAAGLRRHEPLELVTWDILFHDPNSSPYRRASATRVQSANSATNAVEGATLVISAVTTSNSLSVAEGVAPSLRENAAYLDLNSVGPSVKRRAARVIEARGGRYIEAAVLTAIEPRGLATPMLLGGPHAEAFLPVAAALGLSAATLFSPSVGPASAAKMCRSVIIKGLEALLAESLLAARHYGVEGTVLASLSDLLPSTDWPTLARYMMSRSLLHGGRRAEEMHHAAQTVAEAGVDPWMSDASIHRQAWAGANASSAGCSSLPELLDTLLQSGGTGRPFVC